MSVASPTVDYIPSVVLTIAPVDALYIGTSGHYVDGLQETIIEANYGFKFSCMMAFGITCNCLDDLVTRFED